MELKINGKSVGSVKAALALIPVSAVHNSEESHYQCTKTCTLTTVSGDYGATSALAKAHKARKSGF